MTWEQMLVLEPRLRQIDERLAVKAADQHAAYRSLKAMLAELVGFHSRSVHEELKTAAAYDVGIEHIADGLEI